MIDNELTRKVIGCAIEVHRRLGPGLLEHPYQECLYYELQKQGFHVRKEVPLPLVYDDVKLECGYRLDLVVNNKLIIELKSVDHLNDLHLAQVLTYLKLANQELGLLINFNELRLVDGVKRVINSQINKQ